MTVWLMIAVRQGDETPVVPGDWPFGVVVPHPGPDLANHDRLDSLIEAYNKIVEQVEKYAETGRVPERE